MTPLVSCVLVTGNRPRFLRQALEYYSRFRWSNKELVLVANHPAADLSVVPKRRDILVLDLKQRCPIGEAINLGIFNSQGDWVQRMDDDDWYHPDFLRATMTQLRSAPNPMRALSNVHRPLVYLAASGELRWFAEPDKELGKDLSTWSIGNTYAFHRDLWEERPYRAMPKNEDMMFFMDHPFHHVPVERVGLFVYVRHRQGNLSGLPDAYFRQRCPIFPTAIEGVMTEQDAAFYRILEMRGGAA